MARLITILIIAVWANVAVASDPECLADMPPVKVRASDVITACRTQSWLLDATKLGAVDDSVGLAVMFQADKCVNILPLDELVLLCMTERNLKVFKISYQGRNVYMPAAFVTTRIEKLE